MTTIHRMGMNGRPACGKSSGPVNCSGVMVTCQDCNELDRGISREQAMEQIRQAAQRLRTERL